LVKNSPRHLCLAGTGYPPKNPAAWEKTILRQFSQSFWPVLRDRDETGLNPKIITMNLRSPNRAAALAFTIAFATLVAQILFHRIISAKLLNNYAFLVISLTMLGFACSGVILSRSMARWVDRLDEMAVVWTALFVLTTLGATLIFYHGGMGPPTFASRGQFLGNLFKTLPYALLYTVPFIFSGLLLGLLLSSPRLPTSKIYCWDLVGSACGAFAVLPAITFWGVETALLGVCALLLAVTLALARPARKNVYWLAAAAILSVVLGLAFKPSFFFLRFPEGTQLALTARPGSGMTLDYVRWDPVARIEVSRIPPPDPAIMGYPSLIGSNPSFLARFKRMLTQNNYAFTYAVDYDGDPKSLDGIQETIYSSAYIAKSTPNPKVAVIGVGGGFDILTALHFQASEITGIEVNRATLHILQKDYADYFRAWTGDPRVKLVYDDGRHFLKSTDNKFDIIQLSGVDSYSGTPGAANVFSESYLYTTEAFELYFSRLSPNGILNVMRMEHSPPCEMLRVLTTAVTALHHAGVDQPAGHIAMLSQNDGRFMALLVKKSPFTKEEEDRLVQWTATTRFIVPAVIPQSVSPRKTWYHLFLEQATDADREAFYEASLFNIRPATDDTPFFFNFSRWGHLPFLFNFSPWASWRFVRSSLVPVMQITLVAMFFLVGAAALLCVWLPLRRLTQGGTAATPRRHGFIFAGTGLGYLAVEIALLQKFGLYLGHPNYALSVVLAGLLFATGLGALCSSTLGRWLGGPRFISYALALLVMAECAFVFPTLYQWPVEDFSLRVLVVLALVAPLGVLMGTYVPTAVEQLKATAPGFVPWAWGINGIFSVLAPILSVAFSMTWGITALLLSAVPIYLVVGWLYPGNLKETTKVPMGLAASGKITAR
jgi:spermidine synthase